MYNMDKLAAFYDTDSKNYQLCSFLGQCITNVGTVFIAKHTPSKSLVALKKYHLERISREDVDLIQDELVLMRQLSHPNLLPCFTTFVSGADINVVLPLMGYGSCSDVMARHFPTGIPEPAIACILKAVLQALHYLHSKAIIHRAVRASHILISADGQVTLCGLRYSCNLLHSGKWHRKIHSFPPTTLPNLNWLSPELLKQNLEGYNEKCDVYSVGVTACELANGIVPFWDVPTTLMLTEKVRGYSPQLLDCTTFERPISNGGQDGDPDGHDYAKIVKERNFSDSFHGIAALCMEVNPDQRPFPANLLALPWFKQAPHYSSLPKLLLPAVPVLDTSLTEVQDDLDTLMVAEKLNSLEVHTVNWDF